MNKGKIVQVVGPVVDVEFTEKLPGIYHALTVEYKVHDQPIQLTLEVQQHLADNWVRTVSMSGTEGLKRGYEVIDTEAPISVPVGEGRSRRKNTIRSTGRHPDSWSNRRPPSCSPPASRSSI